MPSAAFGPADFKVFDVRGFQPRMTEIRARIRPKLDGLGRSLAPAVARSVGGETFAHVAKHARRTVNPPDDTWVAFGPDRRGYKKTRHFKIAISRHCVRVLFEVGPEYADKRAFATAWKRDAPRLARALGTHGDLGWYKNEHDEEPAAALADLDAAGWKALGGEPGRTRDGQLVLGRRIEAREAANWRGPELEKAALEAFAALGECYRLP
jgi:uncharacterized protein YktB (UPF0637 family)